eukprot:2454965-Pyramimonas_sp.AAC.2
MSAECLRPELARVWVRMAVDRQHRLVLAQIGPHYSPPGWPQIASDVPSEPDHPIGDHLMGGRLREGDHTKPQRAIYLFLESINAIGEQTEQDPTSSHRQVDEMVASAIQ